mmetsp:Transcript_134818/g.238485  ORF Transcript_134818/g.238485 Transcript_134818/m.238485 type:complete len:124 (+) Transcript_134818:281-652(+)
MQTPGIVNLPALFTSLVAMAAKLSMIFEQAVLFISNSPARASAIAVLLMAPVFWFTFFMGAMVAGEATWYEAGEGIRCCQALSLSQSGDDDDTAQLSTTTPEGCQEQEAHKSKSKGSSNMLTP